MRHGRPDEGVPVNILSELRRRNVFRIAVVYAVTAFVVLQVAQLLGQGLDLPDWVFRAITLLALIGFPVALVLAWALELTPDGIHRTAPAGAEEEGAAGRRGPWWTVAFALGAVAMFAAGGWWALKPPPASYDSIAVLPFVNLSAEAHGDYLGDGLAEELINGLGNVAALKVAARTSAFSFKGRDADVREIGQALGVASVLEGSVRRAADRVRIVAQLVDAKTGYRIWGGEYDGDAGDLFALQNRIAGEIVGALAVELGAADAGQLLTGGSANAEAYDVYLRARQRWAGRQIPELRLALDEMRQAVRLDPGFALAWSGVSDVIDALAWRDPEFLPLLPEGRTAALRALALAPDLPEAWASMGIIVGEFDLDWVTAERALLHAVGLRPSYAQAQVWLADVQRYLGRVDESLATYQRAAALDPLSNFFLQNYASQVARYDEPDRALHMMHEVLKVWPDHAVTLGKLGALRQLPVPSEERAEYAERWAAAIGFSEPSRARLLAQGLDGPTARDEALAVLDAIEAELGFSRELVDFAAALGDRERTLALLERGMERQWAVLLGIGADPLYAFVAGEPRFLAILERQKLPLAMPERAP